MEKLLDVSLICEKTANVNKNTSIEVFFLSAAKGISVVVERLPHYPKNEGLSLATSFLVGREKKQKRFCSHHWARLMGNLPLKSYM